MNTLYMFPPNDKPAEDADVLAGEYVLGVLDPGEAAATRLRADTDPALRSAIGAWQARLVALTAMLAPTPPPPSLWERLAGEIGFQEPDPAPPEAVTPDDSDPSGFADPEPAAFEPPSLAPAPAPVAEPVAAPPVLPPAPLEIVHSPPPFWAEAELPPAPALPVPAFFLPPPAALSAAPPPALETAIEPALPAPRPKLRDTVLVWRLATAGCLAAALVLGGLLLTAHADKAAAVAAIGVVNTPAPLYLAEADTAGRLRITPLAIIAVPNGRDLQLWMIPPNTRDPVSLGVLPPGGRSVSLGGPPLEGTRFIVSLEPRGGAPGGRITGQVLYGGTLANR